MKGGGKKKVNDKGAVAMIPYSFHKPSKSVANTTALQHTVTTQREPPRKSPARPEEPAISKGMPFLALL